MKEQCKGIIQSGPQKGERCPVKTNLLTCENGEKSCRNHETQFQRKKTCRKTKTTNESALKCQGKKESGTFKGEICNSENNLYIMYEIGRAHV